MSTQLMTHLFITTTHDNAEVGRFLASGRDHVIVGQLSSSVFRTSRLYSHPSIRAEVDPGEVSVLPERHEALLPQPLVHCFL